MKKRNMLHLLFLMSLFGYSSCGKDELCIKKEQIKGDWIWISSYGGDAGETFTPLNTMSTKRLEIGKSTYREYRNDSLFLETTYTLSRVDEPFISTTNIIMEFASGRKVSVIVTATELELIEHCIDCYSHTYERK